MPQRYGELFHGQRILLKLDVGGDLEMVPPYTYGITIGLEDRLTSSLFSPPFPNTNIQFVSHLITPQK